MGGSMGSYLAFEWAVAKDAWERTWRIFAPTFDHWRLYAGLLAIGALLQWAVSGMTSVLTELSSKLLYGVGAVGAGLVLTFAYNLIATPFRIWKAHQIAQSQIAAFRSNPPIDPVARTWMR